MKDPNRTSVEMSNLISNPTENDSLSTSAKNTTVGKDYRSVTKLALVLNINFILFIEIKLKIRNGNQGTSASNLRDEVFVDSAPPIASNGDIEVEIINPKKKTKRPKPTEQNNVQPNHNDPSPQNVVNDENIDEIKEEIVLKYGARHVIKLFVPVTVCLVFVIISLSLITSYQKSGGASLYAAFKLIFTNLKLA
jgi:hypothetical protein